MNNRPRSITIMSWLLIAMGALMALLFLKLFMALAAYVVSFDDIKAMFLQVITYIKHPDTWFFLYIMLSTFVFITSGILMLKGKKIGRIMYVVWVIILIIFCLSSFFIEMLPVIVIAATSCFFLMGSGADKFFSANQN